MKKPNPIRVRSNIRKGAEEAFTNDPDVLRLLRATRQWEERVHTPETELLKGIE